MNIQDAISKFILGNFNCKFLIRFHQTELDVHYGPNEQLNSILFIYFVDTSCVDRISMY